MTMEYRKFSSFIEKVQYGFTAEETSSESGDAKYLRITDIVPYFVNKDRVPYCTISEEKKKQYIVKENDLLVARTGATTGYNLVVPKGFDNYIFASYLVRFFYDQDVLNPLYLKHVLKSRQYYGFVNNYIGGSAQPGMNPKAFGRFEIPYVEYAKQKRIAAVLSAYDNLIEVNNKRIKVLEQIAENSYKSGFVSFRFPGHENAEFENGIPNGWQILRIEDFCYVTDGTHDTPKSTENGVPLVTGKFIEDGEINFDEAYLISEADHEAIKKRSGLSTGDILFSNRGTVGKSCIVDYQREFSVKNVIIFKPDGFNKTLFLYYWLTSPTMQEIFSTQTNGASQQFVGLTFMRRYKIMVPPQTVLSQFEDQIYPIYQLQVLLRNNRKKLIKQRDLLLPRLMSGKLEIK